MLSKECGTVWRATACLLAGTRKENRNREKLVELLYHQVFLVFYLFVFEEEKKNKKRTREEQQQEEKEQDQDKNKKIS